MNKLSGISANTYNRLLYDAGAVYLNYVDDGNRGTLLGATRGGNTVTVEQEIRQMPVDGSPGDVKGDKRRVRVTAKLSVNLIEMSTAAIRTALTNATATADSTHDTVVRASQIAAGDYIGNVTLVLQKANTVELFGFKLKNALPTSNYELGASDNDEPVTTIEFTGHYLVSDLNTEPWEIFNPLVGTGTFYTLTYVAGSNGSIIGNAVQTVQDGLDGSPVYASPDALYQFDDWSDASVDNPRQDTAVAGNITVTANFSLI